MRLAAVLEVVLQPGYAVDVDAVQRLLRDARRDTPHPRRHVVPVGEHVVVAQHHHGVGGRGDDRPGRGEQGRRNQPAFKGFMSVSPFPVAYWLIIKPPGPKAGLAFQSITAASLRSVIGRASSCSVQIRCSFSSVSSSPGPSRLAGGERRGQVLHALDDPDGLVVHGAFGVAHVVGHPVEHGGQHRLEHRPGDIRADAAVHADAEAEVPVALSVHDDLVGLVEHRRVTVGHRPRDPQPLALLEPGALDLDVLGERATVTRCGGVVAQELLGGGVQQRVAFAAEQLALVRILRQPLQRVRGQCGRGVEAAADDQPEVAEDLQIGCGLAVDAQLQQRVDQAGSRILPDLVHRGDHVDAHLPVHLGDAGGVGRVFRGGHREVRGLAVDRPLLQLDSHHRQREHRGHDVGEVVDEVDPAGLDLLVE